MEFFLFQTEQFRSEKSGRIFTVENCREIYDSRDYDQTMRKIIVFFLSSMSAMVRNVDGEKNEEAPYGSVITDMQRRLQDRLSIIACCFMKLVFSDTRKRLVNHLT